MAGSLLRLGTNQLNHKLKVRRGGIEVTNGNISGSSTSTGSFGNVNSIGTITGSAVYGTTIGQNRTDGLKTITIEANSTVNQDLTTDATPTFAGVN